MIAYIVIAIVALLVVGLLIHPCLNWWRRREERFAVQAFRRERERLEARFFDMACRLGKPRGLIWAGCDWLSTVTFARASDTNLITAFAAVNIHFEAVEGGEMEDVEAVSTIRDASAVFHYQRGRWGTGGRALFNMNPSDAIEKLTGQFEPISTVAATEPLSSQT